LDLIVSNLHIPLEDDGQNAYITAAAQKMAIAVENITIIKILSKELNLKDQNQFFYKLSLVVRVDYRFEKPDIFPQYSPPPSIDRKQRGSKERPIVVGFGPAGMFAALELVDSGYRPLIFERGKPIHERTLDVQRFIQQRQLNPESNIQFGEGGAGSFSDGKLFSRRNNNSGFIQRVLQTFVKFGAPAEIEYISKPHLGTDVLRRIVRNMRTYIQERGGEIFYNALMTDLLIAKGQASGVRINHDKEYLSSSIYLALGHSARETFALLQKRGVALEQRPISVGLRVEHPVETINLMRYGRKYLNFQGLGAASYSLNYTNKKLKRGVYTFCMCPGGEVINASSSQGMLVLNGMSYSSRSSPWSNAALAVTCHTADYLSDDPLAGIRLQKNIEQKAFIAGGGNWAVPAQNLMDFLAGKTSAVINKNSYKMGAVPYDMHDILPGFAIEQLQEAFSRWKKEVPIFISQNAVLMAAETRTSSPVRITRNKDFESINIKNLFPIGEGSGYTGGITSSAADGLRAVTIRLSLPHLP
jgi:uncharacterized FAD-dependent dehydrogenase